MMITAEERQSAKKLIEAFIENKDKLPYANVNKNNTYLGWVDNFNLYDSQNNNIKLDLKDEKDMFLLFILAVVWSRTGPWENSAFFVSYLKLRERHSIDFWKDESNVNTERNNKVDAASFIAKELTGHVPRKKISFRKDIYSSVHLLAHKWKEIRQKLEDSERSNDFEIFMEYMRSISGLGVGNNKILIKIPLILRELKCQDIYKNIPGELCCVPDARVYDAAKSLEIKIPVTSNLTNLKESSGKIYKLFGDLYDLPLFAYEDLKNSYLK